MIWSLQTLRFIAAFLIVFVHTAQTAAVATGEHGLIPFEVQFAARVGVDIFFVLSGVVITMTAQNMTAGRFLWRRVRRILPIYFLVCIPIIFIAAKSGFGWRDVLATFFLWPATDVMTAPLIPIAWTLCFEMLFYLSASLVLADRRFFYLLSAIFLSAMALRPESVVFQFVGNPIILEFFLGVALFYLPAWRRAVFLIPLGVISIVGAGYADLAPTGGTIDFLSGTDAFQRVLVYGLPSAAIVYGTMQIKVQESVWTYLGGASYMLYLCHILPVSGLLRVWQAFPIPPDAIILAGCTVSILLAWRLHEAFERPIQNFLGRFDNASEFMVALSRSKEQTTRPLANRNEVRPPRVRKVYGNR